MPRRCSFKLELEFPQPLAGVDEAGCAPLAGPVVAGACILDRNKFPRGIDDSKNLPLEKREALYAKLVKCSAWGVGIVSVEEIDTINIYWARFGEPVAGELVISGEAVELVPVVVDRIDAAAFGPEQVAAELKIVGRIGEDHVYRLVGKPRHLGDAVALDDLVERQVADRTGTRAQARPGLRNWSDEIHDYPDPLVTVAEGESAGTPGQAIKG